MKLEYKDINMTTLKETLEENGVDTTELKDKKSLYAEYEKLDFQEEKEEKVLEEEVKEEMEKPVEKKVQEATPKRISAREIHPTELVAVRSVTQNGLTYVSKKTGMKVTWGEYGDVDYLEFSELMTMRSMSRDFLEKPYVIIEDEEVAQKLGLTKIYSELITKEEAVAFLNLPLSDIEDQIENLPDRSKDLILETAKNTVGKTFNDIRKIKFLEEKFNVGLSFLLV